MALVLSAVVPAVIVTTGLLMLSRNFTLKQLDKETLLNLGQLQQEFDRQQNLAKETANQLAFLTEVIGLDPNNPQSIALKQAVLDRSLSKALKDGNSSFELITNAKGHIIAQKIRILAEIYLAILLYLQIVT